MAAGDFRSTGVTVGADGVTASGPIAAAGQAISGGSVAATGAVSGASVGATGAVSGASVAATGAVSGATVAATGKVSGKQIEGEQVFVETSSANPLKLYVDGTAGDDLLDGTLGNAVLTMDRIAELSPIDAWIEVHVTGDPAWAGGGRYPYEGFRGQMRIIADDPWTEVEAGTCAAYSGGTGKYGRDEIGPVFGVHVPADATDRQRFIEIVDDVAALHLAKILAWDAVGGVYDTSPLGIVVAGAGNVIRLLELVQTLAPVAPVAASPVGHAGSVVLVGFNVVSPGLHGLVGFGFAACNIDATADANAIDGTVNSMLGGLLLADGEPIPAAFLPLAMLAGTEMEAKLHGDFAPGNYVLGAGPGFFEHTAVMAPGCGRFMDSVLEDMEIYAANTGVEVVCEQMRGVAIDDGVRALNGATIKVGNCDLGWHISAQDGVIVLTDDTEAIGGWDGVDGGHIRSEGTAPFDLECTRTLASDLPMWRPGPTSRAKGVNPVGGWASVGAAPLVILDGESDDMDLALPAGPGVDRGAGPLVRVDGGRHRVGACTGDNANAGGHGFSLLGNGSIFSAANGFALTGNAGGTATIVVGTLAAPVAVPVAGARLNDLPVAPTGAESLVVFEHRA